MEKLNKALLNAGKRILHLYGADVNKYAIQIPFLVQGRREKKIYVTSNPEAATRELRKIGGISIVKPEEFIMPIASKKGARIVIDATSPSYLEFEKKLQGLTCPILCTYDVTSLNSDMLEKLVKLHDKLIITSGSATLLSGSRVEDLEKLDDESVEKFVKNELPAIVLSLILNKPMCGHEIMKTLHKNFNVLISPGSLYPLLKNLEKRDLLKCEYKIKNKIYEIKEENIVKSILSNHIQARRFISKFLEKNGA